MGWIVLHSTRQSRRRLKRLAHKCRRNRGTGHQRPPDGKRQCNFRVYSGVNCVTSGRELCDFRAIANE